MTMPRLALSAVLVLASTAFACEDEEVPDTPGPGLTTLSILDGRLTAEGPDQRVGLGEPWCVIERYGSTVGIEHDGDWVRIRISIANSSDYPIDVTITQGDCWVEVTGSWLPEAYPDVSDEWGSLEEMIGDADNPLAMFATRCLMRIGL